MPGVEGEQDRYTPAGIAALARQVGLSGSAVAIATAIALAESGGNPKATHRNSDRNRTLDVGLWQINTFWHPQYDPELLKTGLYNAQAMAQISKNGTDWSPWTTFTSGRYKEHLQAGEENADAPGVGITEDAAGALEALAGQWARPVLTIVLVAVFTAAALSIGAIGLSKITGVSPATIAGPAGTAATAASLLA